MKKYLPAVLFLAVFETVAVTLCWRRTTSSTS